MLVLLMLQAFIDDSRETTPPIFVLAGYVASTERWSAFSRAFSASSVRSRRASETSRPPNFAFHL
jgi:hypothetical protein